MFGHVSRRDFFTSTAAVGATATFLSSDTTNAKDADKPRFRYCLNSGTILGHKLPLEEQVELVRTAGYDGIEPWIRDIETFVKHGGKLVDLKKRISDAGLLVASAIGFAHWIVEDSKERKAGLEQAKRNMDLVRQIGGSYIAAPPAGATKNVQLNLIQVAERYRKLLEAGAYSVARAWIDVR